MYEFAVSPAVTQIRRRGVEISEVADGSVGAELELEAGDRIMRVNGRVVKDYLDFRFQTAGETDLVIDVRKQAGDYVLRVGRAQVSELRVRVINFGDRISKQFRFSSCGDDTILVHRILQITPVQVLSVA